MEGSGNRSLSERMIGAAMLDVAVYEEVEHDETATSQAAIVVGIVAVCTAIGGLRDGTGGILSGLIGAYLGWLVWSFVTYFIGVKLFEGTATWGELLRTIGFAQSPGVLSILGIIPFLGSLARLGIWIWILVAGIVAIRQALDFTTGKAIATAGLGWLALVLVGILVAVLFRLPLALMGAAG